MSEVSSQPSESRVDPARVEEMLIDHIEELKQRELQKVFNKLEDRGTLTGAQKAQIEDLADNLTRQIVDPSAVVTTPTGDVPLSVLTLYLFDFDNTISREDITD